MDEGRGQPGDGSKGTDWGALVIGAVLLLIGGYILLKDTLHVNLPEVDWGSFWPVILILVGAAIVLRGMRGTTRRSHR